MTQLSRGDVLKLAALGAAAVAGGGNIERVLAAGQTEVLDRNYLDESDVFYSMNQTGPDFVVIQNKKNKQVIITTADISLGTEGLLVQTKDIVAGTDVFSNGNTISLNPAPYMETPLADFVNRRAIYANAVAGPTISERVDRNTGAIAKVSTIFDGKTEKTGLVVAVNNILDDKHGERVVDVELHRFRTRNAVPRGVAQGGKPQFMLTETKYERLTRKSPDSKDLTCGIIHGGTTKSCIQEQPGRPNEYHIKFLPGDLVLEDISTSDGDMEVIWTDALTKRGEQVERIRIALQVNMGDGKDATSFKGQKDAVSISEIAKQFPTNEPVTFTFLKSSNHPNATRNYFDLIFRQFQRYKDLFLGKATKTDFIYFPLNKQNDNLY